MSLTVVRPRIVRELYPYTAASGDRIALIDPNGDIVAVDSNWAAFAEKAASAWHRAGSGANYLDVCRTASSSCADAREALVGLNAVIQERSQFFSMDYSCNLSAGLRWYRMGVMPFSYNNARFAIVHTDITKLRLSRDRGLKKLRNAARRLINAQEEQRKRLARELHDDLGTRITLLSLSLQRLTHRQRRSSVQLAQFSQVVDCITDLSNALRNLSQCLHPPLLQHSGICAALKALCEEFEKTHGVQIDVVTPLELSVPDEVGLCIFRVSQECLHNIAKHAQAGNVSVVLERTPKEVRLKVADTGRGFIPSELAVESGLGLISMKERVLAIRGQLKIQSAPGSGTEIRVAIPLVEKKSTELQPSDRPAAPGSRPVARSAASAKLKRFG